MWREVYWPPLTIKVRGHALPFCLWFTGWAPMRPIDQQYGLSLSPNAHSICIEFGSRSHFLRNGFDAIFRSVIIFPSIFLSFSFWKSIGSRLTWVQCQYVVIPYAYFNLLLVQTRWNEWNWSSTCVFRKKTNRRTSLRWHQTIDTRSLPSAEDDPWIHTSCSDPII